MKPIAFCRLRNTKILALVFFIITAAIFVIIPFKGYCDINDLEENFLSRFGKDVIQKIRGNAIVVNGRTYFYDDNTKVEKEGYNFTVQDLQLGWKVRLKNSGDRLKKIEVLGIPTVIAFPKYDGLKVRVAVGRLRMGDLPAGKIQSSVDFQSGAESILLAALRATNRYEVVDIRSRDEILNEVDYQQSIYSNSELASQVGRQIPAEYIVKGHILSFGQKSSKGSGFGALGVKIGSKKSEITLRMELTLEEISTGTITKSYTHSIAFCSKGSAFSLNPAGLVSSLSSFTTDLQALNALNGIASSGAQFNNSSYYENPLAEVLGIVINKLVSKMVADNENVPWSSVVITVVDEKVIVRGGKDVGLHVGDRLELQKSSDDLIDPETGASLGSINASRGILTVIDVRDRVSICSFNGEHSPSRGDKCLLRRTPIRDDNVYGGGQ